MADEVTVSIKAGDKVRVHYHPPSQVRSFVEGVVRRTEVSTLRGRVFAVDVTYEVVLDREQLVKPGYQNYVLYERWEEFPGRIGILTEAERMDETKFPSEPESKPLTEMERDGEEEMMPAFDDEADGSLVEGQDGRGRDSLIASIFGRRK
jgi:hypothetical protein